MGWARMSASYALAAQVCLSCRMEGGFACSLACVFSGAHFLPLPPPPPQRLLDGLHAADDVKN